MEDMMFKYGIVVVGAVIITLLIAFAFSSLNSTIKFEDVKEQQFSGSRLKVRDRLHELCQMCLKDNVDRECFLVNAEVSAPGKLCPEDFAAGIVLRECFGGAREIKVKNSGDVCYLKIVGGTPLASVCQECADESCCSALTTTDNCFWNGDAAKCIPLSCAQAFTGKDCTTLDDYCCGIIDWACTFEASCVAK